MSLSKRANSTLLIKLIAAGTTYGFSILLARMMTPEGFGQIAFFLNSAFLLSVFGACGQQMALLRFIPVQTGIAERIALRRAAFKLAAVGSVLTFIVVVAAAQFAMKQGFMAQFSGPSVMLGFALILAIGWADFQSHLARGFHRIPLALIPKEILWRGFASALVVFVFLGSGPVTAVQVLTLLLMSLFVVTLAQHLMVQDMMTSRSGTVRGGVVHYGWKRAIGPFWLTSVSYIFLPNADVIIIGIFLGPRSAGLYFAANRLALLLAYFMTSYNVVVAPMLAEAWQGRDATKAQTILRDATIKASIPTLAFGTALLIFAPAALQVFGPEFVTAAPALRLLVLAGIFNAMTGPADIALNMCGYERSAMRISAVTLILNGGLLGLGVLSGSITGVALAVLVGTVLRKGLFWSAALRHMRVRTDILAFARNFHMFTTAKG